MGALSAAMRLAAYAVEKGVIDAYLVEKQVNGKYILFGYKDGDRLEQPLWVQIH